MRRTNVTRCRGLVAAASRGRAIDFDANFVRFGGGGLCRKPREDVDDKNKQIGRRVAGRGLGLAVLVAAAVAPAAAQGDAAASYPNKPIKIVIPFGAGGGNDLFARLVGQRFSELIKQTVVIENKPGAGGRIAAEYVMNQPHDGYTMFVGASGVMSVAAAIYPNLPYHPTKTFVPLTMIANFPLIVVIPNGSSRRRPSRNWSSGRRRIRTRRTTPRPRRPSSSRPNC